MPKYTDNVILALHLFAHPDTDQNGYPNEGILLIQGDGQFNSFITGSETGRLLVQNRYGSVPFSAPIQVDPRFLDEIKQAQVAENNRRHRRNT